MTTWRPHPKHLQCDVRSVMDLCLHVEGRVNGWLSPLDCMGAACTPSDELRFWVAFYESFRVAAGLPRYSRVSE